MVEILRKGRLPGDDKYTTACHKCGTVFSFLRKEAEHKPATDQREADYLSINCPLCHSPCAVGVDQKDKGGLP